MTEYGTIGTSSYASNDWSDAYSLHGLFRYFDDVGVVVQYLAHIAVLLLDL
jgi:hypothetical protein